MRAKQNISKNRADECWSYIDTLVSGSPIIQDGKLIGAVMHLVFRNGIVENLHADSVCLDDTIMKKLNIDINNRIYTMLTIRFNGTEKEVERLERTMNFIAKYYGQSWDPAVRIDLLMR